MGESREYKRNEKKEEKKRTSNVTLIQEALQIVEQFLSISLCLPLIPALGGVNMESCAVLSLPNSASVWHTSWCYLKALHNLMHRVN